jgi:hypothetical protein
MKKNKSIAKSNGKNDDYKDTTEKKIKKKDCSRQSYFKKQNGNQEMKSPSNEEVSLIRFYIDEIIFSIEIETENDENQFYTAKRSIYGLLNQLKLQQEIICDKENDNVLFLRLPHLGIIIELRETRHSGINLKLIHKGTFFTIGSKNEQEQKLKSIVALFSKYFNSFPILTKIDIAIDTPEIQMSNWEWQKLHFAVRAHAGPLYNCQTGELETLYVNNSKYVICFYNKKIENNLKKHDGKDKKKYYDEYFKDYENITRMELRLKSELARRYTQAVLEEDYEEVAIKILADFTNRRRVYEKKDIKQKITKKNQARDLKEWSFWKKLRTAEVKSMPINEGIKIKNKVSSFSSVKNRIIEMNMKNKKVISKEELMKLIENEYDEISRLSQERFENRKLHEKEIAKINEIISSISRKQAI